MKMTEFCNGTLDTMIERLCNAVSGFDKEWIKECIPATEEQVQNLENICKQYHFVLPRAYLEYLRVMGQNDGGLLKKEWDGFAEPSINCILESFEDEDIGVKEDLEKGLLLLSYHWTEANIYLRLADGEDNPVVTDRNNKYFAGSFEKYLFQKAFKRYQEKYAYKVRIGTSVSSSDTILKKYCYSCSTYGGTIEERMNFVRSLIEQYHMEKEWFSDNLHCFCHNERCALGIDIRGSFSLVFSCNDPVLKKKADFVLNNIFGV